MKTVQHTEVAWMESVIRECDVCFVGMTGTDDIPYVLPVG